jgi:MFS family permease
VRLRLTGLWRDRDFVTLWAGQTISLFGSQVTLLALPLAAAVTLDATPAQMGILSAAGSVPTLLVGLFAGVWVDRHRRRPVLIVTNFARAALLATIPLAALLGLLTMGVLYAVAFGAGLLTVCFRVAYSSYLPSLVPRERLVEGNSKLQMSQSAAQVAGPGIAGALVQLATAPIAILLDAASFLVAGVSVLFIQRKEPAPAVGGSGRRVRTEIAEGLRTVYSNAILRSIGLWAGTFNLFGALVGAVLILFVTRELGIAAGVIGLILAAGSVSGLIGALLAKRVTDALGVGRAMVGAALLASVTQLVVPFAGGPPAVAAMILIASQLVFGLTVPLLSVNILTLQQVVTPPGLLGRVNATMQVVISGTLPLGGVLGGVLGTLVGLRPTLLIGALGICLSALWIWYSPLRSMDRSDPLTVGGGPVAAAPS